LSGIKNPYPDGPLGVIEPGAYADILLIKGNPLKDISILTRYEETINLIMKDGKVYKNEL
jgi:imidazolonepropionase-like amidohydrolase